MSFEVDKRTVYLQVYTPVYFQLVDVLLHKAQFPADQEYASWSSDEKEQFRIYRCVCVCVLFFSDACWQSERLQKQLADTVIAQQLSRVFFSKSNTCFYNVPPFF